MASSRRDSSPRRTSTNHPHSHSSSTTTSTSAITNRQLSHLNSQIAQLQANLSDFNDLLTTSCDQYKNIEMLGKIHASIFMASRKVFEEEDALVQGNTNGD
ncbi:uncharacterized protein KGF55_003100 [Candida pseudojiufengensis]|uniref:uncharacterized protein n=1 Tax=Candida pseudojiufengensis TaxID=497109 RepID=UPI0022246FBB|nr:uncharacterized protein KGF55_003100 [Candida pseudojiufengensis]KAI5963308.1 hypothetical protein KGF55_003100 [Candida pseudojiufengensis]